MKLLVASYLFGTAFARCNNDCSNNGICNAGSVCECELNFFGNDCSDRLCYFGRAFIDSGLGDINANNKIDTDQQIYYQYANGLQGEQYDVSYGLARADNVDSWDEAHFYRECSNKGVCDRSTGQCQCFPGFEGAGCRRVACPNDCSGHGQCVPMDVSNAGYMAWDASKTQECVCDAGYTGPDCSQRKCPKGSDPIATVYVNDYSVYKIEWGQTTGKGADIPSGPVHWTISYKDDYGDIWTTSAVTSYYQSTVKDDLSSILVGAADDADAYPLPFANTILDDLTGSGEYITLEAVTDTNAVYDEAFSFHDSFISEQVNASIQALPNNAIRHAYTHTVWNHPQIQASMIYPSEGVPDGAGVGYKAQMCSGTGELPDECLHAGKFNGGKSVAVDDPMFRFGFYVASDADDADSGAERHAEILNCKANAVCVFIQIPEPKGSKDMTVTYKFKPRYLTAESKTISDSSPVWGSEVSSHSNDDDSIVEVSQVGQDRQWYTDVDGTPVISFAPDSTTPYWCSRRGLCDFETGTCKCFDGYSGYRCQERSVLGY
jgi:hypothetical protein